MGGLSVKETRPNLAAGGRFREPGDRRGVTGHKSQRGGGRIFQILVLAPITALQVTMCTFIDSEVASYSLRPMATHYCMVLAYRRPLNVKTPFFQHRASTNLCWFCLYSVFHSLHHTFSLVISSSSHDSPGTLAGLLKTCKNDFELKKMENLKARPQAQTSLPLFNKYSNFQRFFYL